MSLNYFSEYMNKKHRPATLALTGISLFGLAACGTAQVQGSSPSTSATSNSSAHASSISLAHGTGVVDLTASGGGIAARGFDGSALWELTQSSIDISLDGGTSWTSVPLPAVTSVSDVAVTPSGQVWLSASNGSATGVAVYGKNSPQSPWTKTVLNPSWPSFEASQPPPRGLISVGPGPTSVLLERGGANVGVSSNLFVLSGSAFQQRPLPAGFRAFGDGTVIFTSNESAVAQDGNRKLYYSTDGGKTWSESNTGLGTVEIGTPLASGQNIYLPVALTKTVASASTLGSAETALYLSTDGGKTYHALDSSIATTQFGSVPAMAVTGSTIWLAPPQQHVLYESTDGGKIWKSVTITSGLSKNPPSMTLVSSKEALALTYDVSCTSPKKNCTQHQNLAMTNDSGQTWQVVANR